MNDTRIQDALLRFGFQTTTFDASEKCIRLTLRVPPNVEGQWRVCTATLLDKSEDCSWTVDVSRKYFLRGDRPNKKLFYIYRIIFQGAQLSECVDEIVGIILHMPRAKVVINEIPLAGGRPRFANGKGARPLMGDEGIPAVAQMQLERLRGG